MMDRPTLLATACLLAMGFSGCASFTVTKAGKPTIESTNNTPATTAAVTTTKDSAKGQSFYLPKTIMSVTPDPEKGYSVIFDFVPDPEQEYRIKHFATWASSTIDVKTRNGILLSVDFNNNDSVLADEALKKVEARFKDEFAEDLAIAKQRRNDADTKLTEAKTEQTALKTSIKTSEINYLEKHSAYDKALAEEKDAKRIYDKAQAKTQQLKSDYNAATTDEDKKKIKAEIDAAEDAEALARLNHEKASLASGLADVTMKISKEKYDAEKTRLDELNRAIPEMISSLPPKPVTPAGAGAGDAAGGAGYQDATVVSADIGAPVVFMVDSRTGKQLLTPLKLAPISNGAFKQERMLIAQQDPQPAPAACKREDLNENAGADYSLAGAVYKIKLHIKCAPPDGTAIDLRIDSSLSGATPDGTTPDNEIITLKKTAGATSKHTYSMTSANNESDVEIEIEKNYIDEKKCGTRTGFCAITLGIDGKANARYPLKQK